MTQERTAGKALDAEVAEKVIGEVMAHSPCGDGLTRSSVEYGPSLAACDAAIRESFKTHVANGMRLWPAQYCGPDYSGDYSAAFSVVEAMRAKGWVCEIFLNDSTNPEACCVEFWRHDTAGSLVAAHGAVPFAACLAALKAVESTPPTPERDTP